MMVYTGFSWLRKRPVAGYCEHDQNKISFAPGICLLWSIKYA